MTSIHIKTPAGSPYHTHKRATTDKKLQIIFVSLLRLLLLLLYKYIFIYFENRKKKKNLDIKTTFWNKIIINSRKERRKKKQNKQKANKHQRTENINVMLYPGEIIIITKNKFVKVSTFKISFNDRKI